MGKIANKDEVYFNYPIPRTIHRQVQQLKLDTGMPVKDSVINSLIMYIREYRKNEQNGDEL